MARHNIPIQTNEDYDSEYDSEYEEAKERASHMTAGTMVMMGPSGRSFGFGFGF